ncbi:MAG: succinate dehydrogenase, hydrophobic membrane anchor protein [Candidatus Tokpelaia sp.]|nr:MAG: succinate dehydrogenase, hydrophobic membrane anchor protein [Candidatus Tokpelaia sp.]KAA6206778.1 MAG: succinate dehydrogenase, hydrophobic membrane anchor protein [Candidatus Tokpelaia sp.]
MAHGDFRTELGKARGLGAARSGARHFWLQRVTAFANVPLFIFFIGLIISLSDKDYAQIHAIFANPFIVLIVALILLSGIYHMKLGMQVIIEDYVHSNGWRVFILALNIFCSVFLAAASALALVKIMLGG